MPDKRGPAISPLERARLMSQALSDAARRARYAARTRKSLAGAVFQAQQGAGALRWIFLTTFWLMVVAPIVISVGYFGLIAADQYVAEAKFTVAGGEPTLPDGLGALSGIPSITIIQDTQIVTNFLESRAAVEKLQAKLDIRRRYSVSHADYFSRFEPEKPIEKFVRYWKKMISVSIKMPAGIIELKVRAFTPEDAKEIASAALEISEELINDLNDRMNSDAVKNSEAELERAKNRLSQARIALERARNEEGILNVETTVASLNKLITELRSSTLKLQQEYASQLSAVSELAPQMRNLRIRIEAANKQIAEMEAQLTNARTQTSRDDTLSLAMTRFAILDLERNISERLYAAAVTALELNRLTAERKLLYLNTFVTPALPQEAQYPRRALMIFGISIGALVLWGLLLALINFVRNHMA